MDELKTWKAERPGSLFVFGRVQKPMPTQIHMLKLLAFKAGLNCGECIDRNVRSCRGHACCFKWTLHKLRRTYSTLQDERGGVSARILQSLLGRNSLEIAFAIWPPRIAVLSNCAGRSTQPSPASWEESRKPKPGTH